MLVRIPHSAKWLRALSLALGAATIGLFSINVLNQFLSVIDSIDQRWAAIGVAAMIIGGLGAFAVVLWMFARPARIAIALALVLPFEKVPLGDLIGYRDTDLITPVLLLALVALFGRLLVGQFKLYRTGLEWPILLFLCSALVAALLSIRPVFTIFTYVKYAKVIVLCYVVYMALRHADEKTIRVTLWSYIGSAALMSAYSVVMYGARSMAGIPSFTVMPSVTGFLRLFGTLRDPNITAGFLIPPVLLAIYWTLRARRVSALLLWAATALVLGTALLLTVSRSGILAFGCAGLIWAAWNWRQLLRQMSKIVVLLVLLLVVVAATMAFERPRDLLVSQVQVTTERFFGSTWETRASNDMHAKMALWSWDSIKQKPWGVGRWNLAYNIGLERLRMFGYTSVDDLLSIGPPVHNSWLEILASEGVGGFIGFAWMVLLVVRDNGRLLWSRRDWQWHGELTALGTGFCGILISMLFYTYDWMYFFWFLIAIQRVLYARGREAQPARPGMIHA